jgi:hypothetical protein
MNKQKRMVYVYEENVAFYDSLDNKSEFINNALAEAKGKAPKKDRNISYIRDKVAGIDARK